MPKNPGVVNTRHAFVSGRVAAMQVGVADPRGDHFDNDFIVSDVPQDNVFDGPFPLGEGAP